MCGLPVTWMNVFLILNWCRVGCGRPFFTGFDFLHIVIISSLRVLAFCDIYCLKYYMIFQFVCGRHVSNLSVHAWVRLWQLKKKHPSWVAIIVRVSFRTWRVIISAIQVVTSYFKKRHYEKSLLPFLIIK